MARCLSDRSSSNIVPRSATASTSLTGAITVSTAVFFDEDRAKIVPAALLQERLEIQGTDDFVLTTIILLGPNLHDSEEVV